MPLESSKPIWEILVGEEGENGTGEGLEVQGNINTNSTKMGGCVEQ